jgi:hypothetical protein
MASVDRPGLFLLIITAALVKLGRDNESSLRMAEMTEKQLEFVPDWAKKVVWYQIFPERFRNGDRSNDPTVADLVGADPGEPPRAWRIHPWGSDWYALQDYERENGDRELGSTCCGVDMAATCRESSTNSIICRISVSARSI